MLTSLLPNVVTLPSWSGGLAVLLAKATIILVAALAITRQMHRASAGARHLVWLVTLGTLLFVVALTAWAPLAIRILPAHATRTDIAPSQSPVAPPEPAVTPASHPATMIAATTTPPPKSVGPAAPSSKAASKPMIIHNPDGTFIVQKEPPNRTSKNSKTGNGLVIPPQVVVPLVPAVRKKP